MTSSNLIKSWIFKFSRFIGGILRILVTNVSSNIDRNKFLWMRFISHAVWMFFCKVTYFWSMVTCSNLNYLLSITTSFGLLKSFSWQQRVEGYKFNDFFIFIFWQIWKNRNNIVWNNSQSDLHWAYLQASHSRQEWIYVHDFILNPRLQISTGRSCVGWHNLLNGW